MFSECDEGYFGSWTTMGPDGAPHPEPSRYHQAPGQIDDLVILRVNGVLTVIDMAYYEGTPAEHVDEMRASSSRPPSSNDRCAGGPPGRPPYIPAGYPAHYKLDGFGSVVAGWD